MKSPFYFIVKAYNGKRYDNTKKLEDIDFIVSSSKKIIPFLIGMLLLKKLL